MRCLLWFKNRKGEEPKLYLKLNGEKEDMSNVLVGILGVLGGVDEE